MFSQLPIVVQVWGAMLLGAVLLMAGLFVGIEWPWIKQSAITAGWWAATIWRALFTDGAIEADERECCRRYMSPHPHEAIRSTQRDADEILIIASGQGFRIYSPRDRVGTPVPHADDARRRRQLLALAESSPLRKTVH